MKSVRGERVRIRFGNLSPMDHHPIHLHGLSFVVTGTDGGNIPLSAQVPETTVLLPTGSTRVIEFVPTEPGDWPMHCHMTHHTMMEMPLPPNSAPMRGGPGPFSYIDMGGMFTLLKVREQPRAEDAQGWYAHPPGTVAGPADLARMRSDGVVAEVSQAP